MKMRMRLVNAVALAALIALGSAGCSGPKKGAGDALGEGGGLGEEGVGGSLLEKQKTGLGAGESGPLKDVTFDYNSSEIHDDARARLRDNAAWLQANTGASVEIEGHCDDRGTVEYNLALGAQRARAVKEYLAALGVADRRMTTISYGEELPLCYEQNEGCWQRNRRAHFVVRGE
jgi:peptidoglycan-associated lipoprotein